MTTTPNLLLPYILAAQAQKHVTHNEAIRTLDALVQLAVLDKDLAAPPATPADGARYIIAASPSGAWTGHAAKIAAFQDAAWAILTPREGFIAWVADEDVLYGWNGTAWVVAGGGGGASVNPTPLVGVNATADTTNRLSVAAPATLFNHAGAGHQLKINKAAAASTASLLFQDAFSGRAEVGLAGDDDLHVKVSGDGTTWKEALLVNRSTGVVTFPFTTLGGGGGVNPSLAVNGDFQINQRAFAGGALAAGSYGHDRWKAAAGGANYSVSGYVLTLASGTIEQIIETAFWGFASLASTAITVSVDTPSADLTITVGTVAGTITAGSGRRSVTITTAAGDAGNLPVKITRASAGSVTFGRVKVEIGSAATAWVARTGQDERDLCRYYYQRLQATGANQGLGQCLAFSSDSGFGIFSFLPTPMRGTPAVTSSAFGTFRLTKADGSAYATCTAGTMTWSLTFGYVLSLTGGLTAAGAGLTPGGICWVVSLNATTFIACDAEL